MKSTRTEYAKTAVLWAALLAVLCGGAEQASALPDERAKPRLAAQSARAANSLAYVQNMGQWDAQAQFLANSPSGNIWVTDQGVVYDFQRFIPDALSFGETAGKRRHPKGTLKGHVVRMEFVGGLPSRVAGANRLPGDHNYFVGDESRWATNVPRFSEAVSERVYDGVSARWYFDQGSPRYDLIVEPGADPNQIAMRFEGADAVSVDGSTLRLSTSLGIVEHRGLFAYQKVGNKTRQVGASFELQGSRVRFKLGDYDKGRTLVIDPLLWSTFIGGALSEDCQESAIDAAGNIVVAGGTTSTNFPTSVGAYDATYNDSGGSWDGFVSRISADGSTLLFSTYIGGSDYEYIHGLGLDGSGNVVVAGVTGSSNYPTTAGAFDTAVTPGLNALVTKLAADGASLVWSTYLEGPGTDSIGSLALDSAGNVVLLGIAEFGFPSTVGTFDPTHNGGPYDTFVAKLSSNGSTLVWSTFLGGSDNDSGVDISMDASDNVYVLLDTFSPNMPTSVGAFDTSFNSGMDSYVAKLSSNGSTLIFGTYLGTSASEYAYSLALDSSNRAVIVGETSSTAFPTTASAYDKTHNGGTDIYVAKLSATGASLVFSTYLGGSSSDEAFSVALDASNNVLVAGQSGFPGAFPMTGSAYDPSYNGAGADGVLAMLSPDGSSLLYSTYMGSSGDDYARSVLVDGAGNLVVVGRTDGASFPTTAGAYDTSHNGNADLFVLKLGIPLYANGNSYGVNAGGSLNAAAPGVLGNDLGSPTTAVLTQAPVHAAAFALNADGSFSYTPAAGYSGSDTFKYKGLAGLSETNQATVTITVRGVLQSITLDATPIPGGTTASGVVTLTTPAKAGGQTVSFSDSQPWFFATGTSIVIPAGQTSAPFSFPTTPPPYSVTAKVNCTLSNGSGVSLFAMLTIKPLPKAVNDSYYVNANATLSPSAPGVLSNDINLLGGTAVLVSGPTKASSFTLNANGSFSYTPNTNYIGSDSFTYKCQNSGGTGTIVATVSITVRAVLSSIQNYVGTVTGGNPVTGTVKLVGNAPAGGVTVYFSDTLAALNSTGYTVLIPAGSSQTNFSIPTSVVGAQQTGTLTATLSNGSGVTKVKTVTINP